VPSEMFTMKRSPGRLLLYAGTEGNTGPWYPCRHAVGPPVVRTLFDLAAMSPSDGAMTVVGNFGSVSIPATGWPPGGWAVLKGQYWAPAEHLFYPSWGPLTLTCANATIFDMAKNFIWLGLCGPTPPGGWAAYRDQSVFPSNNPNAMDL
jgi:hypothetical protein